MKVVRLLQILLLLAAAVYLFLLHDANRENLFLPFLVSMPPALVILIALFAGWLLGWFPATMKNLRRRREVRQLRRRLAQYEGEEALPTNEYPAIEGQTPIIPDRDPRPGDSQPYTGQEHT